jgi:hypothetical protein
MTCFFVDRREEEKGSDPFSVIRRSYQIAKVTYAPGIIPSLPFSDRGHRGKTPGADRVADLMNWGVKS